jgi:ATP-dependent Clp protease ATP-binding subunit ClpX
VLATLEPLDEETLIRILTEPKNSLVKQYQKLLSLDGIELEFAEGALLQIAKEAIKRNTGARGLRAIIEQILLDMMYELPSREDVSKCLITEETVRDKVKPALLTKEGQTIRSETA